MAARASAEMVIFTAMHRRTRLIWPPRLALVLAALAPLALGACPASDEGPDDASSDEAAADAQWCDEVVDWDPAWVAFEDAVLERVNEVRAEGVECPSSSYEPGAAPLRSVPSLRCAARKHALDMATRDFVGNFDPEGVNAFDRMEMAGYEGFPQGQNLAAGWPTPEAVVSGWLDVEDYCKQLMAPATDETGIGYAPGVGVTYEHYWTQTFGSTTEPEPEP